MIHLLLSRVELGLQVYILPQLFVEASDLFFKEKGLVLVLGGFMDRQLQFFSL
jgi:hypothetical protein